MHLDKFISRVGDILDKPAMYGVNKVEDIFFIIQGYEFKMFDNKKDSKEITEFLNFKTNFRKFVNKHCGSKVEYETFKLIRLYSGSDKHSLELFRLLFFQYFENQNKK